MITMSWRKNITLGLLIPFAFFGLEGKVEKNYQVETKDELKIEKTISGLESKVFALPLVQVNLENEFKKVENEFLGFINLYNSLEKNPDKRMVKITTNLLGIDLSFNLSSIENLPHYIKVPVLDKNSNKIGEKWKIKFSEIIVDNVNVFPISELKKYLDEESLYVDAIPYLVYSPNLDRLLLTPYIYPTIYEITIGNEKRTLLNRVPLDFIYGIFRVALANNLKSYSNLLENVYIPLKRNKINNNFVDNFEKYILDNKLFCDLLFSNVVNQYNIEELHWRNYLMFPINKGLVKNNFDINLDNQHNPVSSLMKIEKIYGYLSPKQISILNQNTNFSIWDYNNKWSYDKYEQFYSRLRSKNKDLETMIDQWIDKEISIYGKNLNQTQIQNIKNNMKVAIAVYNDKMTQFAEDSIKKFSNITNEFYVKLMDTHTGVKYVVSISNVSPLLAFYAQYFTAFNHIISNSGYSEKLRNKYNINGLLTFEIFGFWFDAEEFYEKKYLPTMEKIIRNHPAIALPPLFFKGNEYLNKLWNELYSPLYDKYIKYFYE
ncbi:MAG: hypothetical protein QXS41_01905 [Candidatus Woesearchaeota archaeon]